mmetsp:Transcript_6212/g.24224  ORF Transcript_6212/g.24224 Transcript_6212/m.24224 type:complete len:232 (-) Transcript_6212:863-1558(-)
MREDIPDSLPRDAKVQGLCEPSRPQVRRRTRTHFRGAGRVFRTEAFGPHLAPVNRRRRCRGSGLTSRTSTLQDDARCLRLLPDLQLGAWIAPIGRLQLLNVCGERATLLRYRDLLLLVLSSRRRLSDHDVLPRQCGRRFCFGSARLTKRCRLRAASSSLAGLDWQHVIGDGRDDGLQGSWMRPPGSRGVPNVRDRLAMVRRSDGGAPVRMIHLPRRKVFHSHCRAAHWHPD